jgi:hypothetical protein
VVWVAVQRLRVSTVFDFSESILERLAGKLL